MARKPAKTLTERELEIMQVLWSLGRHALAKSRKPSIKKGGEPLPPSTVATQLNLLLHKGYVTKPAGSGRSLYAPTCGREETTRDLLGEFLSRVGLGRVPAFLIQLLKDERLTAEDRAALQEILAGEPAADFAPVAATARRAAFRRKRHHEIAAKRSSQWIMGERGPGAGDAGRAAGLVGLAAGAAVGRRCGLPSCWRPWSDSCRRLPPPRCARGAATAGMGLSARRRAHVAHFRRREGAAAVPAETTPPCSLARVA